MSAVYVLAMRLLSVCLLPFALGIAEVEPNQWRAGVAKVTISPSEPVWMAGYAGRNGPSDGVLVDLYARALALTGSEQQKLVIVTLDLIEIPNSLRESIVNIARNRYGLRPEELLLNVSHTHGGPMLSAKNVADWGIDPVWGDRAEAYANELVAKVDSLIGKAIAVQAAASVSYNHARCGFAMNRRLQTKGGFRLGPNPDGPVDHDVPVLKIESGEKKLIGLVFGYACHNTSLGPIRQFNGDYAGFAQRKLEQDHSDTVALFMAGCGGDQDPSPRRNLADAEQNGLALASAVEAALEAQGTPLAASLSASLQFCALPFAPLPPRGDLEARSQSGDGFVSRHARWILQQWPNPNDHPPDYQLPIHVLVLGKKLALVALGGEPVVDYSIRLKQELTENDRLVWVAGYSNLVNAYVPSRRELLEGGYEGTEAVIYQSLPGPFQLDIEQRIVGSVMSQVKSAWGVKPAR